MRRTTKLLALIIASVFSVASFCNIAGAVQYVTAGTKGNTSVSDSYSGGKYYTYLSDVILTGDNPTDVIAIALSQLGYHEGDSENELDGLGGGDGNFAEYNLNFGDYNAGYGYYWCASYTSFCLLQAKVHNYNKLTDWCRDHKGDTRYIWRELSCEKWRSALCDANFFRTSEGHKNSSRHHFSDYYDPSYTPQAGDLIFFTENTDKSASHIGFVVYIDGDFIYSVEGNTTKPSTEDRDGTGVYLKKHKISDTYIIGYGDLPYKTLDTVKKIDYSGKNPTTGTYMTLQNTTLYSTADGAYDKDEDCQTTILPSYAMMNVCGITSGGAFRIKCAVDGEIKEGYIHDGEFAIQISSEIFDLSIPSKGIDSPDSIGDTGDNGSGEQNKTHGCNAVITPCVFAISVTIGIISVFVLRKKKSHIK